MLLVAVRLGLPLPDVSTIDALVTLVNAIAAGTALIIHAWNHTHQRHEPKPPLEHPRPPEAP